MSFVASRSPADLRKSQQDRTNLEARDEKKKIRNRMKQRAHRRRKASWGTNKKPYAYHVDRWRVDEFAALPSVHGDSKRRAPPQSLGNAVDEPDNPGICVYFIPGSTDQPIIPLGSSQVPSSPVDLSDSERPFHSPISSDHLLLHLIHYNVYRALTLNKSILRSSTGLVTIDTVVPIRLSSKNLCDGLTLVRPLPGHTLPASLQPTELQMSEPHWSWINMIPFPSIRNNLIRAEGFYDQGELCDDLFGDMFPNYILPRTTSSLPMTTLERMDSNSDDVSSRRNGLIVWGDAWDVMNWEATPRFLLKWGWLLEGCGDLIAATNWWRGTREEVPLHWNV